MAALFSLVTLLRLGMLEWFDNDPGRIYLYLIPIALAFFVTAFALERSGRGADSRYFYPLAVTFTFAALSGVALFHQPYAEWLQSVAPWTRGQIEYLFIINAGIYLVLQSLFERFHSSQLRMVAKSFRFVIPGHVMTSLLLLGLEATRRWDGSPAQLVMRREARIFEVLLPVVACAFVFGSIPKQMKNFFASGLFFLAIGIVRLQPDFFHSRAAPALDVADVHPSPSRPHPGIRAERKRLDPVRNVADIVLDTTKFNVHELRAHINSQFERGDDPKRSEERRVGQECRSR